MKICPKCKIQKEDKEFYSSKNRKRSSMCKECSNKYFIQRWIQIKIKAIEYKGSKCKNCSVSYPEYPYVVFDFHHLDPTQKEFDWNKLRLRSWKSITQELDKCDLLCSNCHRIEHYNQTIALFS